MTIDSGPDEWCEHDNENVTFTASWDRGGWYPDTESKHWFATGKGSVISGQGTDRVTIGNFEGHTDGSYESMIVSIDIEWSDTNDDGETKSGVVSRDDARDYAIHEHRALLGSKVHAPIGASITLGVHGGVGEVDAAIGPMVTAMDEFINSGQDLILALSPNPIQIGDPEPLPPDPENVDPQVFNRMEIAIEELENSSSQVETAVEAIAFSLTPGSVEGSGGSGTGEIYTSFCPEVKVRYSPENKTWLSTKPDGGENLWSSIAPSSPITAGPDATILEVGYANAYGEIAVVLEYEDVDGAWQELGELSYSIEEGDFEMGVASERYDQYAARIQEIDQILSDFNSTRNTVNQVSGALSGLLGLIPGFGNAINAGLAIANAIANAAADSVVRKWEEEKVEAGRDARRDIELLPPELPQAVPLGGDQDPFRLNNLIKDLPQ